MLPSRAAHHARSAESETLSAIPVAEIAFSIVPASTPVGLLSLLPVPGSGSKVVEPASCKAMLDNEPSPERADLCNRSRQSWPTVNQPVITGMSSCDLHCSGIVICVSCVDTSLLSILSLPGAF